MKNMLPDNGLILLDEDLIERAKQGNSIAAEQLFRRYQNRIFSYLYRILRNKTLAEDAAQETFIKGLRGLKNYKEEGSFKSWLFKIAYREGLRVLKKEKKYVFWQKRQDDAGYETPEPLADDPLPDDALLIKEQQKQLESALEKLPPNERQVVLLRIYEGCTFKEISDIMKCPLNTSLGRMHNAFKRLKEFINQEAI
ncbi:MAG: RNA polymerase sigma factor [Desulfobacterales bacterium]|nr:RNA polymerase sigma factor [Desulfobacterales bacterium]